MRVLKVALSIILMICFFWGALIFAGPTIIHIFLQKNFGENVTVSGLDVSADLEIYASRIQVENMALGEIGQLSGYARAINLNWGGVFALAPYVEFSLGPSNLKDLGSFDNGHLRLTFKNNSLLKADLSLNSIDAPNVARVSSLAVNALYDLNDEKFYDIEFDGENGVYFTQPTSTVQNFQGSIAEIGFGDNLSLNNLVTSKLVFEKFVYGKETVSLDEISIEFLEGEGSALIDLSVEGAQFGENLYLEVIKAGGKSEIDLSKGDLTLVIEKIGFTADQTYSVVGNITAARGNLYWKDMRDFGIALNGNFGDFEINSGKQFIANLENSDFAVDGAFLYDKGIKSELSITSSSNPILSFTGNTFTNFKGDAVLGCVIDDCVFGDSQITYQLVTPMAKLMGNSLCPQSNCESKSSVHSISTDNTNIFFKDLIASKMFSPLIAAAIFSQIKSSNKIGDGHQLNF